MVRTVSVVWEQIHRLWRSSSASNPADVARRFRATLCSVRRVRVSGRAPEGLRFELGLRAGRAPLLSYGPGA